MFEESWLAWLIAVGGFFLSLIYYIRHHASIEQENNVPFEGLDPMDELIDLPTDWRGRR